MSDVYCLRSGKIRRLQESYTSSLTCRPLYAFIGEDQLEYRFGFISDPYYPTYNVEHNALMKYKINT